MRGVAEHSYNVTLVITMDKSISTSRGTSARSPGVPAGPLPGVQILRTPGGGQKLSSPGDGGHLTDFVAN